MLHIGATSALSAPSSRWLCSAQCHIRPTFQHTRNYTVSRLPFSTRYVHDSRFGGFSTATITTLRNTVPRQTDRACFQSAAPPWARSFQMRLLLLLLECMLIFVAFFVSYDYGKPNLRLVHSVCISRAVSSYVDNLGSYPSLQTYSDIT